MHASRPIQVTFTKIAEEPFLAAPDMEAVILDFYQAAEYLANLAKAWHGAESEQAGVETQAWCRELKLRGGEEVLEKLKGLKSAIPKPAQANGKRRSDISRTRSIGWITRDIKAKDGRSALGRWRQRAK